jgi:hypothetical protein
MRTGGGTGKYERNKQKKKNGKNRKNTKLRTVSKGQISFDTE